MELKLQKSKTGYLAIILFVSVIGLWLCIYWGNASIEKVMAKEPLDQAVELERIPVPRGYIVMARQSTDHGSFYYYAIYFKKNIFGWHFCGKTMLDAPSTLVPYTSIFYMDWIPEINFIWGIRQNPKVQKIHLITGNEEIIVTMDKEYWYSITLNTLPKPEKMLLTMQDGSVVPYPGNINPLEIK